jgi:hypothetical protein
MTAPAEIPLRGNITLARENGATYAEYARSLVFARDMGMQVATTLDFDDPAFGQLWHAHPQGGRYVGFDNFKHFNDSGGFTTDTQVRLAWGRLVDPSERAIHYQKSIYAAHKNPGFASVMAELVEWFEPEADSGIVRRTELGLDPVIPADAVPRSVKTAGNPALFFHVEFAVPVEHFTEGYDESGPGSNRVEDLLAFGFAHQLVRQLGRVAV